MWVLFIMNKTKNIHYAKRLKSSKIRNAFINYFEKNSHKILDSSTIAPENDDSMLFTNADLVNLEMVYSEVKPKHKML